MSMYMQMVFHLSQIALKRSVYTDLAVIVLISVCIGVGIYYLLHGQILVSPPEVQFSYANLREDVKRMMDEHTSADMRGMGLSKQDLRKQEEQRREEMRCLRTCCSGDFGAKEVVKEKIRTYLLRKGVNEQTILYAIPFHRPEKMSGRELAESLILAHDEGEDKGFLVLYDLCKAYIEKKDHARKRYYEISEEDIRRAWMQAGVRLNFQQQLDVLTQLLFADEFGLGVIDVLNQQKGLIEEIHLGLSGLPRKVYNYKEELKGKQSGNGVVYSKDSIHVLIHGRTIRLSYLGFASNGEMHRVLRNLIKNTAAGELTVNHPYVIVDTMDGRRVSVSRPPLSDAWIGIVRKFDSISTTDLSLLYGDLPGAKKVIETVRQLIRSGSNIAFTGEMEAGKTTLFRAALKEVKKEQNIRVIESGSFELNLRKYMNTWDVLALRVTEETPEQEVLSFVRKTTGHVFAVGEVNSLDMANLTINLSKIAQQVMFSAHYITTEEMVADFKNAKLCVGRYSNEKLAEMDAVKSLGFDVHIRSVDGRRYIQYINEVVPVVDTSTQVKLEAERERSHLVSGGASSIHEECNTNPTSLECQIPNSCFTPDRKQEQSEMIHVLSDIEKTLSVVKTYEIRKILEYDEEKGAYVFCNIPSRQCMEKAKWYIEPEKREAFFTFFQESYKGVETSL